MCGRIVVEMFSEGFIQHELSQTYHDFIHTRVGVAALCINLFYIKNLTINFNMYISTVPVLTRDVLIVVILKICRYESC